MLVGPAGGQLRKRFGVERRILEFPITRVQRNLVGFTCSAEHPDDDILAGHIADDLVITAGKADAAGLFRIS